MAAPTPPRRGVGRWLERFPDLVPPVTTAGAAVTIVLREGSRDDEVLLIERSHRDDDPASGQVALPGGHVAESDGSLTATALRELEEEVGLSRGDLTGSPRYVGAPFARRFGIRVGVFAGVLAPHAAPPTVRSVEEVAHVFWFPRSALDPGQPVERETVIGPAQVLASVHDGHVLWGFTRRVLREFFELPTDDDLIGPVVSQATSAHRPV